MVPDIFLSGIFLALLLCAVFIPATAAIDYPAATRPGDLSDPAEVEFFFDKTMPAVLSLYNVPGATVVVVKDGGLVLAKGYGYTDLDNQTKVMAERNLFRIGSITKLFTWTAVMQLVSEGTIDLDTDVNTYLVDFRIPDAYPGKPVTMRHLMTHTAGFEDSERHMSVMEKEDLVPFREYCANNIPARVRPPGTVSSYSNYGTTLAAVIIEDVTGMSYEQYLQTRILSPLGMNRTSIREDLPPDMAANLSEGYEFDGLKNNPIPDTIFVIGPAGTISSTAPDMAKFLAVHMEEGTYLNTTILPEPAARLMHSRAFANDPRVSGMCLGFYEMLINNQRLIVHGGDTNTFHSLIVILPEEQSGFFVSFNSPGGNKARDELLTEFMDHYYPAEAAVIPASDPSVSPLVQQYTGTYEVNRHNYVRFEKYIAPPIQIEVTATPEGILRIPHGGEIIELVRTGPGIFSRADGTHPANGDIVFHTGAEGTVDFFSNSNVPILVFDRVPWYATTKFLDTIRLVTGLILATVFLWPLLFLFRRIYRVPELPVPAGAGIARWIAGASALLLLVFVFILLPWVTGNHAIISAYMFDPAPPALLSAILTVPVLAFLFMLMSAVLAFFAWKEKYWTLPQRVHYILVTLALIAMSWWVIMENAWVFCL